MRLWNYGSAFWILRSVVLWEKFAMYFDYGVDPLLKSNVQ